MKLELSQAKSTLNAYTISTAYSKTEFENSQLLYNEGRISNYDFQNARNLYLGAQSEEIQAKYKSILAKIIYDMF
jgi:outer membrane protein TolC